MGPDEYLDLVRERADFLAALREQPLEPTAVVAELDVSRATANRALRALADAGLVERTTDGYDLTPGGALALEHHREVRAAAEGLEAATPLLAPLPRDVDLSTTFVATADRYGPQEGPSGPVERLHGTVADADRYRGMLPTVADPRHVRLLYEHAVVDGADAELVVPSDVVDAVAEQFPRRLGALAAADAARLAAGEVPAFGLVLTDHDDVVRASLVVYGDAGGIHAVLETETEAAVRWAETRYERHREAAETVAPDAPGPAAGATDAAMPPALEREGFVRLSRGFFVDRPVADPVTAWRAGLDLAEVQVGYAVERTRAIDGERRSVTEELLDRLRAGRDCAVVGPPGSGKSTVCKRVACEWYRDGNPVFYREHGRGQPFESVDDLVASARAADGHALAVVEDAVRPEAAAVFEAMVELDDEVTVLVDAREDEWQDPPTALSRTAEQRRRAIETVSMPPLLDVDCERLVEHFKRTAEVDVDVPLDELRADLAAGHGATAPNEVFLLLHRLARYADPLVEAETSLTAAVDRVADELRALGPGALDTGVLIALLVGAGVEVVDGYAHALAAAREATGPTDDEGRPAAADVASSDAADATAGDAAPLPDHGTVAAALDLLEGQVLFPRADGPGYRTVHETWVVEFLDRFAEAADDPARRAGRCISALLSLADESRREAVTAAVDEPGLPARLVESPGEWADDIVERLYALGRTRPRLAPLFGEGDEQYVDLPAACSPSMPAKTASWRGEMYLKGGYHDAAAPDFERLGDLLEALPGSVPETERRRLRFDRLAGLADVELGRQAFEAAESHADALLAAAREAADERATARARRLQGRIASNRGEFEAAQQHLEAAAETYRDLGADDELAATLNHLGDAARRLGDLDTAEAHYREALSLFEDLGMRLEQPVVYHNLGKLAERAGDVDEAEQLQTRGLELARAVGKRSTEIVCLQRLAVLYERERDFAAAEEYYEEALAAARAVGDRQQEAAVLGNVAPIYHKRGDAAAAREHFERALSLVRELGVRDHEAALHTGFANLERDCGNLEAAVDHAEAGLDIAAETGQAIVKTTMHSILASVRCRAGEFEAAHEAIDRALELATDHGYERRLAPTHRCYARVLAWTGEFEAAADHLEHMLSGDDEAAPTTVARKAALARERGALETAADYAERVAGMIDPADPGLEDIEPLVIRGSVAVERGDLDAAERALTTALEAAEAAAASLLAARARRWLAALARERGDLDIAADRIEQALEGARACGADPYVAVALDERGRIAAARGAHEQARERFTQAVSTYRNLGVGHRAARTAGRAGAACQAAGDEEAAAEWFETAADLAADAGLADERRTFERRRPDPAD